VAELVGDPPILAFAVLVIVGIIAAALWIW